MISRQPNELYASEAIEVLKKTNPTSTVEQREWAIAPYLTGPVRILRLSDMKEASTRLTDLLNENMKGVWKPCCLF